MKRTKLFCNKPTHRVPEKKHAISSYISKALEDYLISDEEYSLIFNELEKFNVMKEVRTKAKKALRETEYMS